MKAACFLFHIVVVGPLLVEGAPQQDILGGLANILGGLGQRAGQGRLLDRAPSRQGIQNFLNNPNVRNRILSNELNPCDGAAPQTITCTNGLTVNFSPEIDNPCSQGARPETATCQNGETFNIRELAKDVAKRYNLPTCDNGEDPAFLTCRDGTTFTLNTLSTDRPCGGNPFNTESATCSNGRVISRIEFLSNVIPLVQELIG